jgi:hypothetical protein
VVSQRNSTRRTHALGELRAHAGLEPEVRRARREVGPRRTGISASLENGDHDLLSSEASERQWAAALVPVLHGIRRYGKDLHRIHQRGRSALLCPMPPGWNCDRVPPSWLLVGPPSRRACVRCGVRRSRCLACVATTRHPCEESEQHGDPCSSRRPLGHTSHTTGGTPAVPANRVAARPSKTCQRGAIGAAYRAPAGP